MVIPFKSNGARLWLCSLLLALSLVDPATAQSQGNKISVLLDSRLLTLSDTVTRAAMMPSPVKRVIVPMLSHGTVLFPGSSSLFKSSSTLSGSADPIATLLTEARAKGIAVYGLLDLLQWAPENVARSGDIFAEYPDLAERTTGGSFGNPSLGKYASPFHPKVRKALRDIVTEVAKRYPDLSGLVLRFRLPSDQFYGYSVATREASIKALHLDPIDLEAAPADEARELASEISNWRLSEANHLIQEISLAARTTNPKLKIAVLGDATTYRSELRERGRSLDDWLSWLSIEGIEEVMLESDWTDTNDADSFASAEALTTQLGKKNALTATIPLRDRRKKIDVPVVFNRLKTQGARNVILILSDTQDFDRLAQTAQLWSQTSQSLAK